MSWIILLFFPVAQASFLNTPSGGWNWYKNPRVTPPEKERVQKTVKTAKELRKEFEEKLELAVTNPSLGNVYAVQKLQRRILELSSRFQEMWSLTSLLMPTSTRLEDQTNLLARKVWEEEEANVLRQVLRRHTKTHGLFFLFKQDCPYCKAFVPIVQAFAAEYGFSVLAISSDGSALEGFPNVPDNGIIRRVNPQGFYPALLLVPFRQGHPPIPLSWGMVSLSDLKQNAKSVLLDRRGMP